MTSHRIRHAATALTAAFLLLLAGCTGDEGIVQAKRTEPGSLGFTKYYLCLGKTKRDCQWMRVPAGKTDKEWYDRCDVGEAYPDCRASFGRKCEHSCSTTAG